MRFKQLFYFAWTNGTIAGIFSLLLMVNLLLNEVIMEKMLAGIYQKQKKNILTRLINSTRTIYNAEAEWKRLGCSVDGSTPWRIDKQINGEFQLGNSFVLCCLHLTGVGCCSSHLSVSDLFT